MRKLVLLFMGLMCGYPFAVQAGYDLAQLEVLALEKNLNLRAAGDLVDSARFGVVSASAFPNPEIEVLSGTARSRAVGGDSGTARSISLTQPIDLPMRRATRIAVAEAGLEVTSATVGAYKQRILADVRLRYYELLLREAEVVTAGEDFNLVNAVRDRIAQRVQQGESPRFDLIRADAESKSADMRVKAAEFREKLARAQLQQAVGVALPDNFSLVGRLRDVPPLADEVAIREQISKTSPELLRAKAEVARSERALELERMRRLPSIALRGAVDEDPDMRNSRVGLVFSIPLWDQRRGPIGEASAQLAKARNEMDAQSFSLAQSLAAAVSQYRVASTQVNALESGILKEAEAALRVAESAYKFGERGFLEVLDAQRVYRAARTELIAARFQLATAWVEIQRLLASHESGLK